MHPVFGNFDITNDFLLQCKSALDVSEESCRIIVYLRPESQMHKMNFKRMPLVCSTVVSNEDVDGDFDISWASEQLEEKFDKLQKHADLMGIAERGNVKVSSNETTSTVSVTFYFWAAIDPGYGWIKKYLTTSEIDFRSGQRTVSDYSPLDDIEMLSVSKDVLKNEVEYVVRPREKFPKMKNVTLLARVE